MKKPRKLKRVKMWQKYIIKIENIQTLHVRHTSKENFLKDLKKILKFGSP